MGNRKSGAGLVKRGEVWHIDKQLNGRRITESTGETDRARAEGYLAMRIEQIRREHVYGERPRVTVAVACEKFIRDYCPEKTRVRAAHSLDQLLPFVGTLDITMLHDGSLNEYREKRRAKVAPGTINLELATLTRVCNLAARVWRHDNGRPYLDTAPLFQREKGGHRKPYPLTWEEQNKIVSALPDTIAAAVLFAVNTGVRSGELRSLRWDWRVKVPEHDTFLFIIPEHVTKTNTERVVVLNSVARRIVENQRGAHEALVFVDEQSRPWASEWNTYRRTAAKLKIPARFHDLRHTFGQRLRAAGVDHETRQDLLGHKNGNVTTHYSQAELGRLLEAAESIVAERPTTLLRAVQ